MAFEKNNKMNATPSREKSICKSQRTLFQGAKSYSNNVNKKERKNEKKNQIAQKVCMIFEYESL